MNAPAPQEPAANSVVPTVKGIFVRSHIDHLNRVKGSAGVKELERRFGRSLKFGNLADVPVSDEIKILEIALDILSDSTIPPERRAFEAGRLHFKDFATTPWGKMVFNIFSGNLKYQMLHTSTISEKIFKGITICAEETSPHSLSVFITNIEGYNPDHFAGLFKEWIEHIGYEGTVKVAGTNAGATRFDIAWSKGPEGEE